MKRARPRGRHPSGTSALAMTPEEQAFAEVMEMIQAACGVEKVSALLAQLPWTHHLIILGQTKRPEEREFYMRLAIRERWGKRELERQLRAAALERAVLSPTIVSPLVAQTHPERWTSSKTLCNALTATEAE